MSGREITGISFRSTQNGGYRAWYLGRPLPSVTLTEVAMRRLEPHGEPPGASVSMAETLQLRICQQPALAANAVRRPCERRMTNGPRGVVTLHGDLARPFAPQTLPTRRSPVGVTWIAGPHASAVPFGLPALTSPLCHSRSACYGAVAGPRVGTPGPGRLAVVYLTQTGQGAWCSRSWRCGRVMVRAAGGGR